MKRTVGTHFSQQHLFSATPVLKEVSFLKMRIQESGDHSPCFKRISLTVSSYAQGFLNINDRKALYLIPHWNLSLGFPLKHWYLGL